MKHLLTTEIKAMQKLEGAENVLQLHDVLEDPTHLFMILELCQGGDVLSKLNVSVAASIDRRICARMPRRLTRP